MAKATSKQVKPKEGKWLTVVYSPVSLFSLKRSDATSMAARTNLVPTPYAIKMALLKVMLENQGNDQSTNFDTWIKQEFAWIRDLEIRVLPPQCLVVNRNGYKLRYYDQTADKADKTRSTMPLTDGFVFREWVHLADHLKFCCGVIESLPETLCERTTKLKMLFSQINYFSKRGCFFQYLPNEVQETEQPPPDFHLNTNASFTIQPMDDVGEKATFGRINPYSDEKVRLDSDRIIKPGLLPLQLTATSARYDLYQRR